MTLYNIHTCGEGWSVGKFDEDINVLETYLLDYEDTNEGRVLVCSCPGWPRKMRCKHCDMLELFQANDRVDTDHFYDPETKSWHRPLAYPALDNEVLAQEIEQEDEEEIAELEKVFAVEDQPHPTFGPIKRRF